MCTLVGEGVWRQCLTWEDSWAPRALEDADVEAIQSNSAGVWDGGS